MQTKSIVFVEKNRAELIEEPLKALGPKDVLVKLRYSTISAGTERANLTGDPNISPAKTDDTVTFPRRLGYSASGIVQEIGAEVTSVQPGDAVVVSWGKHTQYSIADEHNVHRIQADEKTLREGAMALIATFPLGAIRKCHLEIGESALVMGQGVLGMMAVPLLRAAGAVPVIAVDPIASKRENALKLGADAAFDPYDPEFVQQVHAIAPRGVNVAIEVTGIGKGLDQALDCMARMGRVALLGCTRHSDFTIDYYRKVHGPGVQLYGAHTMARPKVESSFGLWTDHDDIMAVMKLCAMGRLNLVDMIEETRSPEEATPVYHRLATEKSFPMVQFDWSLIR